uniref:Uncharacterized protein n=1 Tax=Arundo donax TaxID=35708 RepID=A0A0A9AMP4_ARUDO
MISAPCVYTLKIVISLTLKVYSFVWGTIA